LPWFEPVTLPPGIPDRGKPNLPEKVDRTKPIELFRLIFDDYVIGKLTSFTNRNYWLNGLKRNQELGRAIMLACIGRGE